MLKKQFNALVVASMILLPLSGCGGSTEPVRPSDEVKDTIAAKADADRAAMEAAGDEGTEDPSN